jgi:hypothetical protein
MPFRYSLSCLYSSDCQQNLSLLLKPKFQYSARTNASLTPMSFFKIRLNVIFPLCLDLPNPVFPSDRFIMFSQPSCVLFVLFIAAYLFYRSTNTLLNSTSYLAPCYAVYLYFLAALILPFFDPTNILKT